jgi:hypothetical protein
MPRRSAASFTGFSVDGRPERLFPPAGLTAVEKEIFVGLIASEKPERFRPSDLDALCAYAGVIALEREARRKLRQEGRVVDGKPSPWLAVLAQAHKSMLSFMRALRLSPLARGPNNPTRRETLSYYDERMLLEDRRDDGSGGV